MNNKIQENSTAFDLKEKGEYTQALKNMRNIILNRSEKIMIIYQKFVLRKYCIVAFYILKTMK